jgi:hypothetical protein
MPLWRNENCNGLADGSRPRHLLGSFSRPSPVFSVVFQRPGQCDGLPAHYYAKAEPPAVTPMQRLEAADRFFAYRLRGATIEIVRVYHSSRRWPERL